MTINNQINAYIESLEITKRTDMTRLHNHIKQLLPNGKLWFLDGKDETGKVISNPNIGYGAYTIRYKNNTAKEFYQIGISANTTGISVYIMGLNDKTSLTRQFGTSLGKATITGYCIKFKKLDDINLSVLNEAIQYGIEQTNRG